MYGFMARQDVVWSREFAGFILKFFWLIPWTAAGDSTVLNATKMVFLLLSHLFQAIII